MLYLFNEYLSKVVQCISTRESQDTLLKLAVRWLDFCVKVNNYRILICCSLLEVMVQSGTHSMNSRIHLA